MKYGGNFIFINGCDRFPRLRVTVGADELLRRDGDNEYYYDNSVGRVYFNLVVRGVCN